MGFPMRTIIAVLLTGFECSASAAQPVLVENGEPRAQIVISETPTRMQRVAAHELQNQIEKISGARLPIVTRPSDGVVSIYVGQSDHLDQLGISTDGLPNGAYRIVSGRDWLALFGDDSDFTPPRPFARNNSDIPRAQSEWEQIVGAPYGMPATGLYKNRLRLPGDIGKPDGATTARNETLEIWGFDERGSFNAVCGFLRKLGARWYMPGEIGEVLPSLLTIPLPEIDETVPPDFALRQFNFRFSVAGYDTSLWAMRLGIRNDHRLQIAHGLARMTSRDAVFDAHPDWFALYGGRRDYEPGTSKNQLCYSNEELFQETVRYARAMLDTYDLESVSIMPPDGYTAICQCEHCRGKDLPDRHERGLLSDHVWEFVNRVAREIAKTHPHAKVLNCAYGVYTLPPQSIEKLEPNVQVCIVGGRRPINKWGDDPKSQGEAAPAALRAAWAGKTEHPLLIFENYPFTDRGWYLPAFDVRALGETVNATKGISQGEDIWLSAGRDFATRNVGFNHFLVYFTARMYWGGKSADVDAMFREYCRLFYGPAEEEMRAFFEYCAQHWSVMDDEKPRADEALALFDAAKSTVDPASLYGRRLATIDDFLDGLRMKSEQLGQKRGPVPVVRLVGDAKDIAVDGRLNDDYWQNCPTAATGRLRELQTGQTPIFGTSFKAGWQGNDLYFAIRCDEETGQTPRDTATRDDDQALWHGDAIEIEIATETHSYYQIAVSPGGHVVDLDRGAPKGQWFGWDSQAEVATQIFDDHWTVEIRLPITQDENDPLHQVVGRKPTQSLPWHINICRQRIRADGRELSALSPTGTAGFHVPLKFAHFYNGRSHRFDSDPNVIDFALDFSAALRSREAKLFLALADSAITDYQRALALEQAARFDRKNAPTIIERIPIEAVKKTAQMQLLMDERRASDVVAEFGEEDISSWPFWKRGDGYHARGRAHFINKLGEAAEQDLAAALTWTSESRRRDAILLTQGQNREQLLRDDDRALDSYRAIVGESERVGSSYDYTALQGIARILTRKREFDRALAALNRAQVDQLRGTWRWNILLSIGDVHAAAGRREQARVAWTSIVEDPTADKRLRQSAEKRLQAIQE